jgi:3-hydroxyisobutyrate dehydrogenase
MGIPMSQHLIKAGYPLTVYNRNTDKEDALKASGAATAASPGELIEKTDVVFVMVSDDQAISDIFKGDKGLLSANTSRKIIINMSTVSPAISKEMAEACQQQGNQYLDAPVSGSVKQAEDGALVIMVGGEADTFEKVKPILEKIGKLALHVGPTGSGNNAKLVINTLLAVYSQGLAEAALFAEHIGIKTDDLINLLNNSALGSPYVKIKGDAIIKEHFTAAFALKHIAKDLRLAKDIGLSFPLGDVAYQTFQDAEAKLGDEDIIAVFKQLK